jgi:hypothetical protein
MPYGLLLGQFGQVSKGQRQRWGLVLEEVVVGGEVVAAGEVAVVLVCLECRLCHCCWYML